MSDATPIDSLNEPVSYALIFKKTLPVSFEVYSISVHKEVNKSVEPLKFLGGDPN